MLSSAEILSHGLIDILVPVLGRPQSAQPLVDSITASSFFPHRILFLCSPGDEDEFEACMDTGCEVILMADPAGPGDYAKKINVGIEETEGNWLLVGADDIRFEEGWDWAALQTARDTGKRFIATNDCANPLVMKGKHATHPFVARSYIEECGTADGDGLYHEGYDHQCVDVEATETAIARDEFAFSEGSIVRHLHPIFTKGVKSDATYEKGMANGQRDIALLKARRPLWNPNYRKRGRR